jgi:uncharacterized protein (TIGR02996 family)
MDEQSFHEAIRTGDAAARLIYADWLEEQGRSPESALLRSGRWCLVPAGSFWMGGGGGKAGKQQVEISHAFYLGAYPVTQREWQDVMGNNPSWFSREGGGKAKVQDISDEDLDHFPVETVSWDAAQEYLKKLNERKPVSGFLYRLPTEAEWEYACRAGAISKIECSYHFYFDLPTNSLSITQANFNPGGKAKKGEYLERTTRVGSYCPNRLGLHDLHGNVWEWCQDSVVGPGLSRVIRGGSWIDDGQSCRSAGRSYDEPANGSCDVGFRVAQIHVR